MSKSEQIINNIGNLSRGPSLKGDESDRLVAMFRRESEKFEKTRGVFKAFFDALNTMGDEKIVVAAFVEEFISTHRHIQHKAVEALLSAIGQIVTLDAEGEIPMRDGRNEFALNMLAKVKAALADDFYFNG